MNCKSLRAFIGTQDYEISRAFYRTLGFTEYVASEKMSYFSLAGVGFYLQDYYVKDWVDNTMMFMEVDNVDACRSELLQMNLDQFPNVRLTDIQTDWWGRECFLYDPSGVLWHFGEFNEAK